MGILLRVVTALTAEARPLVDHFRLSTVPDVQAFRVFRNETLALIVSGPGKTNAAAATAFLHALLGATHHAVWVNVGIAGHREASVGAALLAHKIRDAASGECWYPPLVFEKPCESAEVVTVDRPETVYQGDALFEMEASGFYPTATRFSTGELVHTIKIVSDNREARAENVSARLVEDLVSRRVSVVDAVFERASGLACELRALDEDPPGYAALLVRLHFTVSEKRRLRALLVRFRSRGEALPDIARCRRAGDVLSALAGRLASLPVRLKCLQ